MKKLILFLLILLLTFFVMFASFSGVEKIRGHSKKSCFLRMSSCLHVSSRL
jgi:CHASE3 domain sensor protein